MNQINKINNKTTDTKHKNKCIKSQYTTQEHAQLVSNARFFEQGITLRVYKCPWCHYWHLTSKKEKK